MIKVKAFVQCSYCKIEYSAVMDNASESVFEEAIESLMMEPNMIESLDEDKGICICEQCFKKWLVYSKSDYDLQNGSLDEWSKLVSEMQNSMWNP